MNLESLVISVAVISLLYIFQPTQAVAVEATRKEFRKALAIPAVILSSLMAVILTSMYNNPPVGFSGYEDYYWIVMFDFFISMLWFLVSSLILRITAVKRLLSKYHITQSDIAWLNIFNSKKLKKEWVKRQSDTFIWLA